MLAFGRPLTEERLHASLYTLITMRFAGIVHIEGCWDPEPALQYLEHRFKLRIIPTLCDDGSLFRIHDKLVRFEPECVKVYCFY